MRYHRWKITDVAINLGVIAGAAMVVIACAFGTIYTIAAGYYVLLQVLGE